MKGKNNLKITDEMIGSDELSTCCSTIADKMIIAVKDNAGSSMAVKKTAKSSQRKIKR